MKKESNPNPTFDKPKPSANPPRPGKHNRFTLEHIAHIFNLWVENYKQDPDHFERDIFDQDGNIIKDYGQRCAQYFLELDRRIRHLC